MARRQADQESSKVRFEPIDVPPLLPLWLAAGLGGCVILVLVGIMLGYPLADSQQNRGPMQPLPPSPRLQVAPRADLERYQAAKERELQKTGLPLDAAMRATVQQGWGPPK